MSQSSIKVAEIIFLDNSTRTIAFTGEVEHFDHMLLLHVKDGDLILNAAAIQSIHAYVDMQGENDDQSTKA